METVIFIDTRTGSEKPDRTFLNSGVCLIVAAACKYPVVKVVYIPNRRWIFLHVPSQLFFTCHISFIILASLTIKSLKSQYRFTTYKLTLFIIINLTNRSYVVNMF
jgi:hypothetical protein